MPMKQTLVATAVIGSLWLSTGPSMAADLPEALSLCVDCHGEDGVSAEDDMPTIAGMSDIYLADNMVFYARKERDCVDSRYRSGDTSREPVTMCEIAAEMTQNEIDVVSEHYSRQTFVPAVQDFDAAQAAAGATIHDELCENCHEDAGSVPDDDAGILAGQWIGYLRHSFEEYRGDKRPMIEKMEIKFDKLSAEDIEALIHFYASRQ